MARPRSHGRVGHRNPLTTAQRRVASVTIAMQFDTPKAGTVMSFGTIGYSIAVAAGDRPSEQVFLNTIRYLLAK